MDDNSVSCNLWNLCNSTDAEASEMYSHLHDDNAAATQNRKHGNCPSNAHLQPNGLFRQIFASCIGTSISVCTLNPISVIKISLQRQDAMAEKSFAGAIRTVMQTHGIRGFWAGTGTGLLQAVPSSVLYMTTYESLKNEFSARGVQPSIVPGMAGACARFYSVTSIAPLELIKTLQASGRHESAWVLGGEIIRRDGVRGLYRGWTSTVMRDVPFSAVYWMSFERLKSLYRGVFCLDLLLVTHNEEHSNATPTSSHSSSNISNSNNNISKNGTNCASGSRYCSYWPICSLNLNPNLLNFVAGASSGVLAAVITHPFDVLKTQSQIGAMAAQPSCASLNLWCAPHAGAVTGEQCALARPGGSLSLWLRRAADTFISGRTTAHLSAAGPCPSAAATATAGARCAPWHALVELYASHGVVHGLYRGLSMRLLTVIPSSAIMVTVYEFLKNVDL